MPERDRPGTTQRAVASRTVVLLCPSIGDRRSGAVRFGARSVKTCRNNSGGVMRVDHRSAATSPQSGETGDRCFGRRPFSHEGTAHHRRPELGIGRRAAWPVADFRKKGTTSGIRRICTPTARQTGRNRQTGRDFQSVSMGVRASRPAGFRGSSSDPAEKEEEHFSRVNGKGRSLPIALEGALGTG